MQDSAAQGSAAQGSAVEPDVQRGSYAPPSYAPPSYATVELCSPPSLPGFSVGRYHGSLCMHFIKESAGWVRSETEHEREPI